MNSSQLLGITTLAYLLSTALYMGHFIFKSQKAGVLATLVTVFGIAVQTVGLGLRWYESYQIGIGHAPLTNMYESLVFFAWCTMLLYVVMEYKFKTRIIGTFVAPFALAAMAYASFAKSINQEISPLVPALQSNWLIAHVITCFIGYAAFAVAGGLGMMYLLKKRADEKQLTDNTLTGALPDLRVIDDITHKTIVFGFLWLSAGIISGAVWANEAWGTYWSWDPKETWSLITWFVYASTLHARFTRGWSGSRIAWLAMLGFIAVFFTYFGVNFWLSGLHSYGSG
jgi:cytochrome c-type biogenesis protein CcsB